MMSSVNQTKCSRSTILSALSTLVRAQTRLHLMVSRLLDARFLVDKRLQTISLSEKCYQPQKTSATSSHKSYVIADRSQTKLCSTPSPTVPTKTRCSGHLKNTKHDLKSCDSTRLLEKRDGIERELDLCFAALKVVAVKFTRMTHILREMERGHISSSYKPSYEYSDWNSISGRRSYLETFYICFIAFCISWFHTYSYVIWIIYWTAFLCLHFVHLFSIRRDDFNKENLSNLTEYRLRY